MYTTKLVRGEGKNIDIAKVCIGIEGASSKASGNSAKLLSITIPSFETLFSRVINVVYTQQQTKRRLQEVSSTPPCLWSTQVCINKTIEEIQTNNDIRHT